MISTKPIAKAMSGNIIAQTSLILQKLIYLTEYYISLAILLFMNNYPYMTAYFSPILYL